MDIEKTGIVLLFSIFFTMSLLIGNFFQKTFGQSNTLDTFDQEQIEKFRDLGEKGYVKDCLELGLGKSACEKIANTVKSQAESYQQNQTSNNTELQGTKSYVDSEAGFSFKYPSDWHESNGIVSKGTREFIGGKNEEPRYSLLDTTAFGGLWFNAYKDDPRVKIIDKPGSILIGGEPAVAFSYSMGDKATMVAALMHNNIGYLFEYNTLKKNFDKDTSTALDLLGSIRFLN